MTPRIAIVGGGIGGLSAAAFLHRAGLSCTVFEQASELREVGAGLIVAPNAARLLRRLGVLEPFARRAVRLETGWEFRRWRDGTILSAEDLAASCERLYGEHTYTAHRADLLEILKSLIPNESLRLSARLDSLSVDDEDSTAGGGSAAGGGTAGSAGSAGSAGDGGTAGSAAGEGSAADRGAVTLRFASGETVRADVVIGADGIHSVIRGTLTSPAPPAYSGLCAFRALVPAEKAPEFARRPAHTLWLGPDHHLVHYPVSAGRYVNLVAIAPAGDYTTESWTATATVEEFLAEFDGWDPRLAALIGAAGTPGRWALLDRAPLARWSGGPVTLLGDAAHPMFPFFAQGAAQAMEDAAVLARCLADCAATGSGTSGPAASGRAASSPAASGRAASGRAASGRAASGRAASGRAASWAAALRRYESLRLPRTTRLQEVSHARAHANHLPDGPEQQARDASFAAADPLVANGWIYAYDPDTADPDTA